jgi:hypothetical protein
MVPNEDFAELVRSGFRVPLHLDDIAVVTGRGASGPGMGG